MKKRYCIILIGFIFFILLTTNIYAVDDVIVMLDPGHGGNDSGASGGGLLEKNITWKIATKVKQILDDTQGITGILTRGENECPEIYQRGDMARDNGADLMVSFHINSSTSSLPRGSEVYVTRNTRVDRFYKNSNILAVNILNNLADIGIPRNGSYFAKLRPTESENMYPDGTYADYYGIIRYPMNYGIPGILIEHCFISNLYDRVFINNDAQIEKIARADAQAIIDNKELFRIDKTKNSMGNANYKIEISTNANGQPYLYGEVLVNDWVNDMRLNPSQVPTIRLKSTDGTKTYDCWSIVSRDNIYYFDILLNKIDKNKEYYIEIESNEKNLIPKYSTQNMELPNKTVGWVGTKEVKIENNKISFIIQEYSGDLAHEILELGIISKNGKKYIKGKAIVTEWINGIEWSIPKEIPIFRLNSVNGDTIKEAAVTQLQGNTYEFMIQIDEIDMSKEYELEIETGTVSNISKYRKVIAQYKDGKIGDLTRKEAVVYNNKIQFINKEYYGDLGTQINSLEIAKNVEGKTYIKGKMNITEWIGSEWNIPDVLPTIFIKSEDGKIAFKCWVNLIGNNTYYFDTYIEGIDIDKKYNIEVSLSNPHNISKYKTGNAYYGKNETLGVYEENIIVYKDEMIIFQNNKYRGDVASQLINIELIKNTIIGEIYVTEWLDGTTWSIPDSIPIMKIKQIDGDYKKEFKVTKKTENLYEFEINIEGIDIEKQYTLEITSGNENNTSIYKSTTVNKEELIIIGEYNEYKMKMLQTKIYFE